MAQIADYMAHTGTAKLIAGGDIDVDFTFPAMGPGGQGTNCILGMMVDTQNANDLKVEGRLGGQTGPIVFTYGPSDTNLTRFFQRVFNGLSTANNNNIHLRIVGGTGSFSVSNMVLWFQRDV